MKRKARITLTLLCLFLSTKIFAADYCVYSETSLHTLNTIDEFEVSFTSTPVGKITFQASRYVAAVKNIEVYLVDEDNNEYKVYTTSNLPEVKLGSEWVKTGKYTGYWAIVIKDYKLKTYTINLSDILSGTKLNQRTNYKKIIFKTPIGNTLTKYVQNINVYLPYYLETDRSLTQTIAETNVFETKTLTSPIVLYHSNLAKKMWVEETDASGYFSYTLTDNVPSGSGTFGSATLQISYLPETYSAKHTATFKVTDGSKSITFTINGSSKRVNRNLTWTINNIINVSEGYFIEAHDVAVARYNVGSKSYGPWYGKSTTGDDKVITYSSSNTDIAEVYGNNIYPTSAGQVTITATMPQTESYNALNETKTITITTKQLQTINWPQTLRYDYPADVNRVVELTATASSGLPITYSIEGDGSVATLSGNKITIRGEGRVNITATQGGNDLYEAVSETKRIIVRDPNAECEEYALEAPTEVRTTTHIYSFFGTEKEYTLNGKPAGTLTFEAKREKYIGFSDGNCFVDVEYDDGSGNATRHSDYYKCSPAVKLGEYQSYSVNLPRNAQKIWLTTNVGATGFKDFRNVYVTQATYIESEQSEIVYHDLTGTTARKYIYINYSNMPNPIEIISPDERYVRVVTEPFGEGCGDWGRQLVAIDVTIPPSWTEKTYNLTFKGGEKSEHQLIVPVKLKSTGKGPQAIDWTIFPTLTTASEETTSTLGATAKPSNLTVQYGSLNSDVAYFEDNNLVILKEGTVTITADQPGNEFYNAAEQKTHTFIITIADLTFDNYAQDKNWFNPLNWKPYRIFIPNHLAFATLEADVEIDNTKIAYAKKLTLDNHNVTIKADGSLHAETILGANTATPLIQLAAGNATQAPAALATKSTDVNANVGIYVQGSAKTKPATWQYFGIPFSIPSTPAFYDAWVCEWSEPQGGWSYKRVGEQLYPWTGYCITQPKETETYGYAIDGTIQTGNHTYELSFTKGGTYQGDNIVTNSYTAPIDITKLQASDFVNTEKAIYIFNTGTYEQWEAKKDSKVASKALAGQYLAIPALVADYSPYDLTVIPPMQAFCLSATGANASFTVNYDRAVWNTKATSKPKRMPRRSAENETYNTDENLIIDINGSRFADAISVLKRSNCSSEYDDGYDAYKWEGNSLAPQLFSTEEDNKIYSVDTRETLEGHYIGLKPGEDNFYTITFRLVETDDLYYLKDLTDNTFYPIVEDMSITVEAGSDNNHRFQIVSEIDYDEEPEKHQGVATDIALNSQTAYLTNTSDQAVTANIYDMTGKVIQQQAIAPNSTFNYQLDQLPRGTYIISLGSKNQKIVR